MFLYLALTDALQKTLERPEEVDELILYQLQPEDKSTTEDAEQTPDRDDCYGDMDEDTEDSSTRSRMSVDYGDERSDSTAGTLKSSREAGRTGVENEIAMLIYKNGLVFDAKTDSPWNWKSTVCECARDRESFKVICNQTKRPILLYCNRVGPSL